MDRLNLPVFFIIFCALIKGFPGKPTGRVDLNRSPFLATYQKYILKSHRNSEDKLPKNETSIEPKATPTVYPEIEVMAQPVDIFKHLENTNNLQMSLVDKRANPPAETGEAGEIGEGTPILQKRFLFLNLKMTLNIDMEGGSRRRYELTLPSPQIIDVYEAYIQAASTLQDVYPNAQNPFNLSLLYKPSMGCFQIVKAFGQKVDQDHVWTMDITNYHGKSIYRGTCLPDRYEVKVGPFHEIALTYTHMNEDR